jgi:GntR family transcriptional regulator, transcriptional repressor for pyruvate dehydrogenase complex
LADEGEVFDLARLGRLTNAPAWQLVADDLRRRIALGLYRPGDLLPAERQLAEGMGVSRITVREALRVLQGERLIETRRSNAGGAVVCTPRRRPPAEVREELRRDRARFLHILDCRLANEALAAQLAAAVRTDAHLEALNATITAMDAASRSLDDLVGPIDAGTGEEAEAARRQSAHAAVDFRRQDSIFHLTVASIPGNPYLYRTIEWLRTEFFTPLDLIERSRNRQDSAGEHAAIVRCLHRRDGDGAAAAMRVHIESTRRSLDSLLEDA